MDTWGFIILALGIIMYYVTKKQAFWLFVSGTGLGIVIGAVGSYIAVMNILR